MNFKVGDNVHCFADNKLTSGKIIRIYENMDHCEIRCINGGNTLQPVKLIVHNNLVKVPKFVADWIKYCKKHYWGLFEALDDTYESSCMPEEVTEWMENCHENQEIFARAWLDGYEVEQDPLYNVQLIFDNNRGYLNLDRCNGHLWLDERNENSFCKTKFTEEELKKLDERYWHFAVPVEEVEAQQ
ncbi:DUF1642 domain-containing protein [Listeria monocytogenes]|nr:DUF1642 domain-containing protein [Listeria monocytogenes]EAG8712032.1 DUF1642 domain-containing protein [Listeria monocytogenes]EAG8730878.1 DUF1642 domain-containing protein [Listeria monocytogenes]